jgi:hypothetical protein
MFRTTKLDLDRDVLLFFEDRDRDTFVRGDRRLRRTLRKVLAPLRPNYPRVSGFELSFMLLVRALERAGRVVHVNNFRLALQNPSFPVGLCGYTHILDGWRLPNPAVLGPGLFDHPLQAPALMSDPRFRVYLAFCEWMRRMFAQYYGDDTMALWFGGMDLAEWPDEKGQPKDIDFLVYDKIRWNRDTLVPSFRDPLLDELTRRDLSFEVLRYGQYTHETYHKLLQRSRGLLFLCEHETQGMAYQEAMASNVPVLAWDQGYWLDPNRPLWEPHPVPASSVPYFGPECGERFGYHGADDFPPALDRFLAARESYTPRAWVAEHLSFEQSAQLYLEAYDRAGRDLRVARSAPRDAV